MKVKNRFKNPAESGYRDLNVLVQLPKTGQRTFKRHKYPTQAASDSTNKARSLDISVAFFIEMGIKQKDHAHRRGLLLGLIFRL
ncbi:Uncharacterised protein [Vibrio cholerae]|nr:Uncharacterised protein [Vibrio cholerae]